MGETEIEIDSPNSVVSTERWGTKKLIALQSERDRHPSYQPRDPYFDWMNQAEAFVQTEF